jgi:hypothetical protein
VRILVFAVGFVLSVTAVAYCGQGNDLYNDIFTTGYVEVTGTSEGGQSRYQAIRAATLSAQRDLLEILKGINLHGSTTVEEGMLLDDKIKTSVDGFLKGAEKCTENGEQYFFGSKHAEVCLRIDLRGEKGLATNLIKLYGETESNKEENYIESSDKPSTLETQKEKFDGLIVDLDSNKFTPSVVNKLVTENKETIFGPKKVLSEYLALRGCGGFTNNIQKAKSLLKEWGAANPLVVKVKEVLDGTDAVLSKTEEGVVLNSDSLTNYLSEAKVVYLIR